MKITRNSRMEPSPHITIETGLSVDLSGYPCGVVGVCLVAVHFAFVDASPLKQPF